MSRIWRHWFTLFCLKWLLLLLSCLLIQTDIRGKQTDSNGKQVCMHTGMHTHSLTHTRTHWPMHSLQHPHIHRYTHIVAKKHTKTINIVVQSDKLLHRPYSSVNYSIHNAFIMWNNLTPVIPMDVTPVDVIPIDGWVLLQCNGPHGVHWIPHQPYHHHC